MNHLHRLTEAQRSAPVTVDDLRKLAHTLGVNERTSRNQWGYRNHYCPGDDALPAMQRLVAAGLMRACPRQDWACGGVIYRATAAGADLLGLPQCRVEELARETRRQEVHP